MRTQTYQLNGFGIFINPNQKKVILNVTFHCAGILPFQRMRIEFSRNNSVFLQVLDDFIESNQLLFVVCVPLQILFELTALFNDVHNSTTMKSSSPTRPCQKRQVSCHSELP